MKPVFYLSCLLTSVSLWAFDPNICPSENTSVTFSLSHSSNFLFTSDDTIPTERDVESPTEDKITNVFVEESQMKADLLQMLANFSVYLKKDYQVVQGTNSVGEACGCFKGENTMGNNEQGVRPNADLSMICAFLVKYGQGKVQLPEGVSWNDLQSMAMNSLVFAYSTHKANKLKTCSGGQYWGSTSTNDAVWESSLWAMSVAYSAFFQWENLSDNQRNYIYKLLKAECNYELYRSIPTGYSGDTKAEENGWEADVLAVTLGLFPDDPLAPKWFDRLREFAINSYSHKADATDTTVIDPDYDQKTVKDLYKGQNLYPDYTLQNHNYFHTSYQNVVIQELGEAALALKLFQQELRGEEKWKTNALMHNNDQVMKEVLYWLALADGELAMPNGNDWSLFLYDQITSYSTNACFLRDPHALMLENLAYKMIMARQTTTADGSWLLRADVGARRMGVEAHRVMMSWLMHEILPTSNMKATDWDDFNTEYGAARHFPTQNIVRAATSSRFTTFSWSAGLKSYTGYIAANSVDKNKIIVPYRINNTGNFLGWYEVSGKATNATPVISGIYDLRGNSYVMNGELNTNDATLNNRFAIYSTPGNAVIYIDYVRANSSATITAEKGGLMAISVDDFTKTQRTLYSPDTDNNADCHCYTHQQLNGSRFTTLPGQWVNIDNALSIVNAKPKNMAFGERANNNSINTAKLYASYSKQRRSVKADDVVDSRAIIYYSNISAETTNNFAHSIITLDHTIPKGWNGVIVPDGDSACDWYLLLSNFASDEKCKITDIYTPIGKPVFSTPTVITANGSSTSFITEENHSVVNTIKFHIYGKGVTAQQAETDSTVIFIRNDIKGSNTITIIAVEGGEYLSKKVTITTSPLKASIINGNLMVEQTDSFPDTNQNRLTTGYKDITAEKLVNASFEDDETYGKADGRATANAKTYNPCYLNTVTALDNQWPNILPVHGWTAANSLSTGSKYARMYSMPYSTTLYCVSPSNVGNYADRCGRPIWDEECGQRTLTVLNSWDTGANAITQDVELPEGTYRLLMDARYVCTNEMSNNGHVITAVGNTNTSLTGIQIGDSTDFRFPTQGNAWQQLCFDFELKESQTVTISIGVETSSKVGAANNTLLYVDNLRLMVSDLSDPSSVKDINSSAPSITYDLQGRRIHSGIMVRGLYIQNGKLIMIK